MRSSKILLLIVAVLLAAELCAAQSDPYDWQSWGAVVDTLRSAERGKRLTLSSPFIVAASEKVVVNGVDLSPGDYEINYGRGLLRITTPVGEDAVVVVSYTRQPFLLNSVYSLRAIEYAEGQMEPPPDRPTPPLESQPFLNPTGNLVFGGAKSISFTMGSNKSASVDQMLRATIEGDLTSTIHVKALLSDNNLPIQPEGNTQELEYLDQVFVEITGPHAAATLGDFAFSNDYSSFNAFRRELTGASARVDLKDRMRVELAGGSSKGVFRTMTFRGTNQLQGPYDLLSQSGNSRELIIAGTEQVYFDGERL